MIVSLIGQRGLLLGQICWGPERTAEKYLPQLEGLSISSFQKGNESLAVRTLSLSLRSRQDGKWRLPEASLACVV